MWCARQFIGNELFAVLLGDDIVQSETPCLKQIMTKLEEKQASNIVVQQVAEEETHMELLIQDYKWEAFFK